MKIEKHIEIQITKNRVQISYRKNQKFKRKSGIEDKESKRNLKMEKTKTYYFMTLDLTEVYLDLEENLNKLCFFRFV